MDSLKLSTGAAFLVSARALAPIAYRPEDTHLGDYVFVPWVRSGLAAAIVAPPAGNRAVIAVRAEVADSANTAAFLPVSRSLTLYGPGDVAGIDPSQIIRREPTPGTRDAEEGYLAHIEFARPDFPWMFSPAPAAGDACAAWLALIVVEAAVSHLEPARDEIPAQIWTKKGQLQSLADNARFCHAQVVGAALSGEAPKLRGADADSVETRLSDEHGPANLSRILCPRRLDDGVEYIAVLVPAYECGVQAGRGMGGGTLAPAWTRSAGDEADDIVLPAYDAWTFRTAAGGDFRALAEKITGLPAPWQVGRRFIDMSQPGGSIPAIADGAPEGIQMLECALFAPPASGTPAAPYPIAQREAVRLRIDEANAPNADLPRVGARLYARFQRGATSLGPVFGPPITSADADADWFSQLNTDPRHRLVAGLGARVVQQDQEPLMQAAWAQVEGVRRANQALAWAGMAEVINISIMRRHMTPLDPGRLMQVTRNMHQRLRDTGQPRTIAAAVIDSRTSSASMSAAFRRATRPDGALGKRAAIIAPGAAVAGAGGFLDQRVAVAAPDGITRISDQGMRFFADDVIARVMGVPVAGAKAALGAKLAVLTRGTAIGQLTREAWVGPDAGRPGDVFGRQMLTDIAGLKVGATQAGGLAEIIVGLMNVGGELAAPAKAGLGHIATVVPAQDLGRVVRGPIVAGPVRGGPVSGGPVFGGPIVGGPGAVRPLPTRPGATMPGPTMPGIALPGATINLPTRGRMPVIVDAPPVARGPAAIADRAEITADPPERRYESDLSRQITTSIAELNKLSMAQMRGQLATIVGAIMVPPKADTDLGALNLTRSAVLAQIEPRATAKAAFKGRVIRLPDCVAPGWFDTNGLRPIMAAPVFNRAMYQALDAYDRDWLVPGLGAIAERDFMTLLSINPAFAEAFLIGASDEMGRELLWRDYPTDQRGTYFKRFWDALEDELTAPVHRFSHQPLGHHFSIGGDKAAGAGALALVVRGDLLRRFPDTVIAAMQSTSKTGKPSFIAQSEAEILFHAHLAPDYTLVGFDLTPEKVQADGNWWFVLAQNPTAPRFGLATNHNAAVDHNNLDWGDLGNARPGDFLQLTNSVSVNDENSHPKTVTWPGHAGTVARVLLTNPIRAAFRADKMLAAAQNT